MVRVTVWGENVHERNEPEVRERYPEGMHGAIAAGLTELLGDQVRSRTATLDQPDHGLPQEVIDATDVLTWWGHIAHDDVDDAIVTRVHEAVLGGMGLLVLHSAPLLQDPAAAARHDAAASSGATRASASWSGPSTRRTRSRPASRTRS